MRDSSTFKMKSIVFGVLFVFLFTSNATAQQQPDPRQQPLVMTLPNTDKVVVRRDLTFKTIDGTALKMDESRIGIWASSANVPIALPIVVQEDRKYIRSAAFYYGVMNSEKVRFDVPMLVARAGQDVPNINGTIDAYVKSSHQNKCTR